jgi:hypothetical protein
MYVQHNKLKEDLEKEDKFNESLAASNNNEVDPKKVKSFAKKKMNLFTGNKMFAYYEKLRDA